MSVNRPKVNGHRMTQAKYRECRRIASFGYVPLKLRRIKSRYWTQAELDKAKAGTAALMKLFEA